MKQDSRAMMRRSRLDGDQLVMLIVMIGLAWSCWTFMRPPERVPQSVAAGDASALAIFEPPLQPGWVHRFDELVVKQWWTVAGFEHHIQGQVARTKGNLQIRPWLYTSTWLPQPVVNVADDGTFDAALFFSPQYDGPMVLALELEDHDARQVIARVNFFFRPTEGDR